MDIRADKSRSNKEEFIEKAKEVHGDKYGYDKVVYHNCDTKVTINCPIHGDFEQSPYCHLTGQGCSKCNKLGGIGRNENLILDELYEMLYASNLMFSFEEERQMRVDYSSVLYRKGDRPCTGGFLDTAYKTDNFVIGIEVDEAPHSRKSTIEYDKDKTKQFLNNFSRGSLIRIDEQKWINNAFGYRESIVEKIKLVFRGCRVIEYSIFDITDNIYPEEFFRKIK